MSRITLKEVAIQAGVSPTAVSRYLNRSIVLPAETAARIDHAVQRLNYRPNPHARSLSLGRSEMIGLVLPDIANPFFSELAAAVEEAADARGFGVALCVTANRPVREIDYLRRLGRNHVDGMLFVTNHGDDGSLAREIGEASAIVLLDEDVVGAAVPKVFSDNAAGGQLAARHLLDFGHRRLAYVGGPATLMSARERAAGFGQTARGAGLPSEAVVEVFGDYTVAHGRDTGARLLDRAAPPTAVFAGSDQILLGLLETFAARGVRVPDDVSLVTFDDVAPLAFFGPPMTAIRQAVAEMGRRGVERVLERIGAPQTSDAAIERLGVELIARRSVAPPRPRLGLLS